MFSLFLIFLRLGCTSFGGPVAHLGYFHREFVTERKWFSEAEYTELLALCHFLPGPASSQVGMAIGYRQAGIIGSLIAFIGFTLPSVMLMIAAAFLLQHTANLSWVDGVLHAMKLLAVAVVADAVWGMAKKICITRLKFSITILTAVAMLLMPGLVSQLSAIALAGIVGAMALRQGTANVEALTKRSGFLTLPLFLLFGGLLFGLPFLVTSIDSASLAVFDTFYRAGGLVFGGGHVVLPMLQAEPLISSQISQDQFLTAYSLAQAVPGPMFTIASYLGFVVDDSWVNALIATAAIFLPGWLLIIATLSVWPKLKSNGYLAGSVQGIVAATVGLLVAALYQPVFSSAVLNAADMAVVILVWTALSVARLPIWGVVIVTALAGGLFL
ncbi:chromate efflux transporter [Litoribrevibacter euphylliae]|uniref:Chromate efflux transporter n=1 Tax=Litoribrevibacter euphylliae TaxID=1834034 RepID=A0ABV7HBF2_9GAMM